jgi:transcriptional regulator with XRE-family HTH domain
MTEIELREGLAQRLREARVAAGLSQGQAAQLLSIHPSTLSQIEHCVRTVTAHDVARFSDLYHVTVDWLLGKVTEHDVPKDWDKELEKMPNLEERQRIKRWIATTLTKEA